MQETQAAADAAQPGSEADMAYFAQAGQGQAYDQGGVRDRDAAHDAQYQQYQQQAYNYAPQAAAPGYGQDYGAGSYAPYAEDVQGYDESYGDPEYGDHGYYPASAAPGRRGLTRAAAMLGAAASLALVAGIGIWGYKLIMRDVSGVPVVRAVEGPMREQPVSPGGTPADHQGLAVNAVAATGTAEDPASRLTLAPPAMELTEDDKPAAELAAALEIEEGSDDDSVLQDDTATLQDGSIDALVAELTDGVAPFDSAAAEAVPEPEPAATPAPAIVQPEPLRPVELAAVQPAVLDAPGVRVSLRPAVRPARVSPAVAVASAPAAAAPAAARAMPEVDPASLPAGTRLAQLGAYESAEVARAEWDRIYGRFAEYLDGKQRVIQRAESGGRTFYRLRAMGFEDLSDARRFCSALVAGNADCIPVTAR